jgi:hypothetical protein
LISTAAKLWFAVAGLAAVAFGVYEIASHGDWFGSFVLGTVVIVALLLGVLGSAVHDGDIAAADTSAAEVQVRSALPAPWPALLAVGAGVAAIGLAGKNALLWVGVGIAVVVLAEWMVQSWAERASADPAYNTSLRHRIMSPFEIPVLAALIIGGFLIALSRVLLALPKTGSTVLAIVLAALILAVATLVTTRPRVGSSALAGLLAVGAVALIAGGIAGGIAGERDFEHHESESHGEAEEHGEKGNNAEEDEGGEDQSDAGADPVGARTDGDESGTGGGEVRQPGTEQDNTTPASQP